MESSRTTVAIGAVAVLLAAWLLAACGSGPETTETGLTRPPLTPAQLALPEATTTTTTTAPIDPQTADRLAQTEIRSVLSAAQEWYAESGTFDDGLGRVSGLADGIAVVSLEEAAARDGVAYDAHGQRLTLHRASTSGTWFCIDVQADTIDHGYGESFQESLATCTDGVAVGGWGDSISPTGPDEASIQGVIRALLGALETGSVETAHDLFLDETACPSTELAAIWPDGLTLTDSPDYELHDISVDGDSGSASFSSQPLPETAWPFEKQDVSWRLAVDPCDLLAPLATERMDSAARALLEEGLFAVRSAFVVRSDFAFAASILGESDPSLTLVPGTEVAFGTLSYTGTTATGLLVTAGSPGRFYCAVESLSAATVYGEGAALSDLDTPTRCRAHETR
jgi:hypothetical protein